MFMSDAASPPLFINAIWRVYSVGWIAFPSFVLLLYIYISKNSRLLFWPGAMPLIIVFPLVFIVLNSAGFMMSPPSLDAFGWHLKWVRGIAPVLFFSYYISFSLLGVFFLVKYAVRVKNARYKNTSFVIIACTILTLLLGTYIRVILPELFHTNGAIPDITDISLVIMAFAFNYAVSRRGLFNITPATAAENIIAGMGEALMLLNDYFEIVYSNEAATTLLGFSKDEFIGRTYNSLFAEKDMTNSWIKEVLMKESLHSLETDLSQNPGLLYLFFLPLR